MQVSQCATRRHSDGTMASRNKQRRILFPSGEFLVASLAILLVAGCGSVALALPQAAPANSSGAEFPIAIIHVTVIDTRTGGEDRDRTVVISDGRILSVRGSKNSRVPSGARILDATGKFLIPGLWDMHVHETRNFDTLPLYIANGVTGVREMSGPPDANRFRLELAAKHPLAPHIYLGSPLVDGNPPDRPAASIVVETQDQAREVVDDLKRRGADFIKVYNELSPNAYFAIVAEAKRQHIPVEGHIPVRVSALEATAAGQKSIEHLLGIARACSSGNQDELLSKRSPLGMNWKQTVWFLRPGTASVQRSVNICSRSSRRTAAGQCPHSTRSEVSLISIIPDTETMPALVTSAGNLETG